MNKIFFLIILFGLASAAGIGMLSTDFAIILQKLGVFHTEDVGLDGCECFDENGVQLTNCDQNVLDNPLCPSTIPPP